MGHTGTASPIILQLEELPTITCVHPSLINSTMATRRLPRTSMAPQPLGPMDSRLQDLLISTDIPDNPKARSMAKSLHRGRKEDTGAAIRHHRSKEAILELDTALADSNIHLGRMGSLHPARADGVAIHQGIKLQPPIEIPPCWPVYCCGRASYRIAGFRRIPQGQGVSGGLYTLLEDETHDDDGNSQGDSSYHVNLYPYSRAILLPCGCSRESLSIDGRSNLVALC